MWDMTKYLFCNEKVAPSVFLLNVTLDSSNNYLFSVRGKVRIRTFKVRGDCVPLA